MVIIQQDVQDPLQWIPQHPHKTTERLEKKVREEK